MLEHGIDPPEVAEIVGVRRQSVYRWKAAYEEEGMEGLDAKPQKGGRDPKLPETKLPELEELLLEGVEAHGFETDLWTLPRVATLIEDEFDVSVSPTTAFRYLQKFDWTRNSSVALPSATRRLSNTSVPSVQPNSKKAERADRTLAFIDESKFRLLPTIRRTYAPAGETPVRRPVSSDPVVVISALTYTPRTEEFGLFVRMQQENFENQSVRSFLRDVMTLLPRKPVFLLDNWSAHIKAVEILKDDGVVEVWKEDGKDDEDSEEAPEETAPDGAVVYFPTYAPELNPTEYVWSQSKYAELANYTPKTTDVLQRRASVLG